MGWTATPRGIQLRPLLSLGNDNLEPEGKGAERGSITSPLGDEEQSHETPRDPRHSRGPEQAAWPANKCFIL